MEPIYLFTIAGGLSMAAALSARQVMQDNLSAPSDDISTEQSKTAKRFMLAGNLAFVALVLALIYGWQQFAWWIPVAFLIVTFPALYYVFLQRLLSAKVGTLIYCLGGWLALIPVLIDWVA
ncbi:MAG: hypothetical protein CMH96_02290 [Oceanospirillaceae bacterium]|nr:hypothetical protein [Oceanospirillaceae bacterium]HCI02047.1 hypothetical protein [Oceanospirillaceae bacterium]